jgi:hypothetical protein
MNSLEVLSKVQKATGAEDNGGRGGGSGGGGQASPPVAGNAADDGESFARQQDLTRALARNAIATERDATAPQATHSYAHKIKRKAGQTGPSFSHGARHGVESVMGPLATHALGGGVAAGADGLAAGGGKVGADTMDAAEDKRRSSATYR